MHTNSQPENQNHSDGSHVPPGVSTCESCGQAVDQHVLTLFEVFQSMHEQLEEIDRRLAPLEAAQFEIEHQKRLEAGYQRVEREAVERERRLAKHLDRAKR